MIDTELSSTQLAPSQMVECKLFLFLTPQRKVIACAVVQRIQSAYRVVSSKALSSPEPKADLLRFGEQEGAIFCSYVPSPPFSTGTDELFAALTPSRLSSACTASGPRLRTATPASQAFSSMPQQGDSSTAVRS